MFAFLFFFSQEVTQLIVERTTVMNHIVPPHGNRPELADKTLTAVLSLYTKYLRKAKEPDKEAYDWVSLSHFKKNNFKTRIQSFL